MKIFSAVSALAFFLYGAPAAAAPICNLLSPGHIEAALGTKITAKSEAKGAISIACNYELAGSTGGPGFFSLQLFTVPIPRVDEHKIVMHTPTSKVIPVPGIGDKALIVDDSNEMIVRKGTAVYSFGTRGVPCEKGYSREESERCAALRVTMLKAIGALVSKI